MSAVSNSVMPRSIALWITLREVSRSVRWPKLLQPRPTAETRRPEPPRLRICMDRCSDFEGTRDLFAKPLTLWRTMRPGWRGAGVYCGPEPARPQAAGHELKKAWAQKKRPRSDAA